MHPHLNVAVKAVRSAANIIMRAYIRPDLIKVFPKGERDFVTNADKSAEQSIIYALQTAYPTHAILAEESGSIISSDDQYQWIIDPIDGTLNFIHGFPHFCISVALRYKKQMEQAVIYDPIRDDLFTATRGQGAQKNNHRIRVSQRKDLKECLVSTGLPFKAFRYQNRYQDALKILAKECAIRRTGSAALDLAYVAAGHLDGFWALDLEPWDMAAGTLLIREAGGFITNISGKEHSLHDKTVLTANIKIAKQLLKIIQPYFHSSS